MGFTARTIFLGLLSAWSGTLPTLAMGPSLPVTDPEIRTESPCLQDVESSVAELSARGSGFRFNTSEAFPKGSIRLPYGTAGFKFNNHIQGLVRLRDTNILVLSGNADGGSYLYVVQMGTQPPSGRWLASSTNLAKDTVLQVIPLCSSLSHPGGMQSVGRIVAVGIDTEQGRPSEVRFFDFNDPLLPVELGHLTIRRQSLRAESIALTKLATGPNRGRYLAAVSAEQTGKLTFYLSSSPDLLDPMTRFELYSTFRKSPLLSLPNHQAIQFLNQCDGKLFVLGSYKSAPLLGLPWGGKDRLELYSVDLLPFMAETDPETGNPRPRLDPLRSKHMRCDSCFFSAGGGVYVESNTRDLKFYSTDFWPLDPFSRSSEIRFEEFAR